MKLYNELCKRVDEKYHKRLREIVAVMDPSLMYTIKHTRNSETFKDIIKKNTRDDLGFKHIHSTVTVFSGNVTVYPYIKVSGEFVVALIKNRMLGPNGEKRNNVIVMYEKNSEDLSRKLGVIGNVQLHG